MCSSDLFAVEAGVMELVLERERVRRAAGLQHLIAGHAAADRKSVV